MNANRHLLVPRLTMHVPELLDIPHTLCYQVSVITIPCKCPMGKCYWICQHAGQDRRNAMFAVSLTHTNMTHQATCICTCEFGSLCRWQPVGLADHLKIGFQH